jgi:lipopolysaccharide export system permease protein
VTGFNFYQTPNSRATKVPDGTPELTYVHAGRAALSVDRDKGQLRVKLQDAYFETRNEKGEIAVAFAAEAEPLLIDLKDPKSKKLRPTAMTNEEVRHEIATNKSLPPKKRVQLHSEITRRYSFSMACLAFAFVAVPLGLNARRRDTSGGLIISLLIGTGYFMITLLADQFKSDSAATMMLWAPNAACVLLGLFLFRRARFK